MTEKEIMSMMYQFHDLSITGINISYEGGGDDGCINDITTTSESLDKYDINNAFETILDCDDNSLGKNNKKLLDQLEEFTIDNILDDIEDWWNNEGGYGNLCILIPSGEYKIYNSIRYTNVEIYHHEGELLEKFK
jgi:hypothetical protein